MKNLVGTLLLFLSLTSILNAADNSVNPVEQVQREVAFTIDDLPVVSNFSRNENELMAITNTLVTKLVEFEIPAYGFVIGAKMTSQGSEHLDIWLDAGLQLGNHSYSHPDANRVGAEAFTRDIAAGTAEIQPLLQSRNQELRYFRFPMLRRGNTVELKTAIEEYVTANGYISAPVSIDNQDWVFNRAYDQAITMGNQNLMEQIGLAYVDYLENIFAFFEGKSIEVLSYEPKQILLLHANALNADYIDKIAEMLIERNYKFISLEEALTDPIYSYPEEYIGTRGLSWIHRVADTMGLPIEMEPHESAWLESISSN